MKQVGSATGTTHIRLKKPIHFYSVSLVFDPILGHNKSWLQVTGLLGSVEQKMVCTHKTTSIKQLKGDSSIG